MHTDLTPPAPARAPRIPFPLDRQLLRRLAQPAPWRLLAQTAFEWICIAALIVAAEQAGNIAFSVLCMLLIATRMHALLALMHEYSHWQLSRTRPVLNDVVGDVFTALPFFISVHGFRRNHLPHHRHTSTAQDPNWMSSLRKARYHFPMSKQRFYREIFKHCIGWYTWEELKGYTVDSGMALALPRATRITRALFAAALLAALAWFDLWRVFLLYWIVPMSTFLMAIFYLRDVGEHFGMPTPGIANSRTVKAGWLDRLLISQNAVNYHAEHHLYPSVPFFRLAELHRALMENAEFREQNVLTAGYFSGLVEEVTQSAGSAA